ncbi:MAG: pilus assembly protein PilM [Phycisphaerae bacterium]|nr:pilus assembly protein PilM [Phycisphaerae bacterium]
MWRNKPHPGPIAIDVGATSLRMLQLAEGVEGPYVVSWFQRDVPPEHAAGAARDAWVRQTIREALATRPFRGREVVLGLGAREFQLKNVRVPPMPPEDLAAAVEVEAQERFGFSPDAMECRILPAGQVRQGSETREEVLLFAVSTELIGERLEMLQALRLEPVAIDVGPAALARCFGRFLRRSADEAAIHVFLDVGARSTTLSLLRGSSVCFAKVVEIGGADFTQAVAGRLGISEGEAYALRMRLLRAGVARQSDAIAEDLPAELVQSISDAVRPKVEHLSREVQLMLRYFTVTFRGQRPECLTFVGGEAHEPQLVSTLAAGAGVPCTIGQPFRGVGSSHDIAAGMQRAYRPAWSIVMGLALRGTRSSPGGGDRGSPALQRAGA